MFLCEQEMRYERLTPTHGMGYNVSIPTSSNSAYQQKEAVLL